MCGSGPPLTFSGQPASAVRRRPGAEAAWAAERWPCWIADRIRVTSVMAAVPREARIPRCPQRWYAYVDEPTHRVVVPILPCNGVSKPWILRAGSPIVLAGWGGSGPIPRKGMGFLTHKPAYVPPGKGMAAVPATTRPLRWRHSDLGVVFRDSSKYV